MALNIYCAVSLFETKWSDCGFFILPAARYICFSVLKQESAKDVRRIFFLANFILVQELDRLPIDGRRCFLLRALVVG